MLCIFLKISKEFWMLFCLFVWKLWNYYKNIKVSNPSKSWKFCKYKKRFQNLQKFKLRKKRLEGAHRKDEVFVL